MNIENQSKKSKKEENHITIPPTFSCENATYTGEDRDRIVKDAQVQGIAVRVIKKLS